MDNIARSSANSSQFTARLEQLEQTIEAVQENARQMAVIAANFQPNSQEALNNKLQTLVTGLQEINAQKSNVGDLQVPIELLERLNKSENPQLYTRHVQERTMHTNEMLQGKQQLYDKFRAELLTELTKEMKRPTMKYRQVRERASNVTAIPYVSHAKVEPTTSATDSPMPQQ